MTGFKGFCHIPAPAQNLLLKHRSVVARTVVWYFTSSPHPPQLQRLWRSPAPRPPPGVYRHPLPVGPGGEKAFGFSWRAPVRGQQHGCGGEGGRSLGPAGLSNPCSFADILVVLAAISRLLRCC